MPKPFRRRVYLFLTRSGEKAEQVLIFSHNGTRMWSGVQTPGGTVEPNETPLEAALREATEETGLTQFGLPVLLASDEHENDDECLGRSFFQIPVIERTEDAWTYRVQGEGVDGGIDFFLRWVDLPEAGDLDLHFRAYLERVQVGPIQPVTI
ncbi:MAG: NUDIX hydrolase [Fimbriimonas sp.]